MNVKQEAGAATEKTNQIVYVRPVDVHELPKEAQGELEGLEKIWALHSEDGERLALVKDREVAFILARQNALNPMTVH